MKCRRDVSKMRCEQEDKESKDKQLELIEIGSESRKEKVHSMIEKEEMNRKH